MSINQKEIVVPEGYMQDRKGRLVPIAQVSDYDLEMDAFVRSQVSSAEELHQHLKKFKGQAFDNAYACLDLLAEKYERKPGGVKGNVTFPSFDGSQQVKIAVQDSLTFGPELQVAKDIIDECLREWSKGADDKIQVLVADAFEVDKEGKLSTSRILSLRRTKLDDPRWRQAMDAIAESLQVAVSKTYINFKKKDESGKLVSIVLDIAGV
ncbi:DUF3164 family protein [Rahnella sp. ChDrAdgB13]|uniref:DUF3164 family protein n=1 Tax=Rahnella sp. ChDrAdgB13 TaxID=1850581 RepID=UPI001AD86B4D|nr:DUF3164 family protein [Rahnella sp. ChDrAdgB13]